ncbi:hypothetical protein VTI74DRAFT_7135 [Chaetomium olivicolor]
MAEALNPSWHPAYPHAAFERNELPSDELDSREQTKVTVFAWPHPQIPDDATYLVAYLSHPGVEHGLCTIRIFKSDQQISPRDGLTLSEYQDRTRNRKFDRMKQWMREDWQKWEKSTDPFHHGKQFPPRLLDLGVANEEIDGSRLEFDPDRPVHLIDTREAQKIRIPSGMVWVPYAVLSHRWGPSTAACRTTKANALDRYQQGIKVSSLCKTFQDAIVVALEMGMPYLWIDSLCIIQDDDEDWRHQSSYMDDIYMNSLLTIAAHSYSGNDGGSGFLSSAFASEGAEPVHLGTLLSANRKPTSLYARHDRMFEVDIFTSPLSRRGWVLQERLLSPRIIHFFPSQLYYETRSFNIVRAEDRTPAVRDPDQLRELIFRRESQHGATPTDWFLIVERYSACELTKDSDKLVAISGIAKHFQQRSGVRYLAGLWLDRAAKGLLWLARGPSLKKCVGRAPSWSWAAVDGPVRYPSLLLKRPFRVLPALLVEATKWNSLEEPKHIMGQESNVESLYARAYVRRAMISDEWLGKRDSLLSYYPQGWEGQALVDLDAQGVYREVRDDDGSVVGWASLDEDRGGECPLAGSDLFTAIVATEEAWVWPDRSGDVLYRTHPHTPEYEAFYATGRVAATFQSSTFDSPVGPPGLAQRELVMTYWCILLRPEQPSEAMRPFAKFTRVGFAQVFERRWQRPDDLRTVELI